MSNNADREWTAEDTQAHPDTDPTPALIHAANLAPVVLDQVRRIAHIQDIQDGKAKLGEHLELILNEREVTERSSRLEHLFRLKAMMPHRRLDEIALAEVVAFAELAQEFSRDRLAQAREHYGPLLPRIVEGED
jgi:hypothetical protein